MGVGAECRLAGAGRVLPVWELGLESKVRAGRPHGASRGGTSS